jgi:hypothetical protein
MANVKATITLGEGGAAGDFEPLAGIQGSGTHGEFTIRGALVLSMDPVLGDFRNGDVHVRDGVIVAIGERLVGGGAMIDGAGFIAMPTRKRGQCRLNVAQGRHLYIARTRGCRRRFIMLSHQGANRRRSSGRGRGS